MITEPPFESRQQLIACQKDHERRTNLGGAIYVVLLFSFMIANVLIGLPTDTLSSVLQTVQLVTFLVVLSLQLPVLLFVAKCGVDRLGLRCPACHKPLVATLGRIAVATGRCGGCGNRVWRRSHPDKQAQQTQVLDLVPKGG